MRRLAVLMVCGWWSAWGLAAERPESAAQWPQWRGPLANGISPDGVPPLIWSETKNVRWKVRLPGEGSGTPIVWGDRVYVSAAVKTDRRAPQPARPDATAKTVPPANIYQFVVHCLDRDTGAVVWQHVAREAAPREGRHETNSYASASPLTDGERLYVSFGSQGLYCYSLDGAPLWDVDLGEMRTRFGWGEGASPTVHADVLVVNWDQEENSFIVALNARDGSELWRKPRDEPTSWATPLVIARDDRTQVVVNGTNRARGYDLATGEVLWECGGQTVNVIPSPVYDDRAVYLMSGYRGAMLTAVPLDARGDVTGAGALLWTYDRGTPYVPSPVLVDGRLYFTAVNTSVLTCLDARTGQALFGPQRLPELANVYASPVAAAGRIYFTSREGATTVIAAKGTFEVLSTNRLDEGIDASPAVVGRQMFLRGKQHLYCLEEAGE